MDFHFQNSAKSYCGNLDPTHPDVLTREAGDRTICSVFNFENLDRKITAKLPDAGEYDVWNFFEERYEGRFSGTFDAAAPRVAARHYAFTPAKGGWLTDNKYVTAPGNG
ncbi:MAG: hypothetical protein IKA65_04290 [Lentisphaeria bacterium]|nr:hypothetical protein [Lentisphaeria bacterium]